MLEYEKQILLDIVQEDGLVIAARGLGLELVLLNLLKSHCDSGNLVFVLGTEGKLQQWLESSLKESGVVPPPRMISSDVGAEERQLSYLEGGIWFVPTRILVVDLLKKRVPIELITGIFVWKAHNILKNHQESFILRLYRQGNRTGFIKAFSNHAPSFKGGLSKVEQILKALFVRKLFLWPRYQALVKSTLSAYTPHVVELHLEMSQCMLQLQTALLDLVKISVQELKRLNPMLDTDDVTVENAICDYFQKILHSQLDPVWHALSERTKDLLADLKLFHYMIRSLIMYDSVSFHKLVSNQRLTRNALKGSGWHLLPAAEVLFTVSAQRIYYGSSIYDEDHLNPEPNPKWLAISELLGEIYRKFRQSENNSKKEEDEIDIEKQLMDMFEGDDKGCLPKILILTRDERTCAQLQTYLTLGAEELLKIQYRKCFGSKKVDRKKDNNVEEEENAENVESEKDNEEEIFDTYFLSLTQAAFSQLSTESKKYLAGCFEDTFNQTKTNDKDITITDEAPTIVIKSYKNEYVMIPQILKEMKPRWVILYDSDVTLIRQLEVHQRNYPNIRITVYFLMFRGTVEEEAYLTSLRKEREAFDFLIEEKARVVIPEDRSDCAELTRDACKASIESSDSRVGGIVSSQKSSRLVIVDMREFRSELPALIHARGIDIEPLTITVGDYILSPDICVERKSVSDLISSLNSGRLYNQALALTRNYSRPMLLIEFDKDKPFDLQDRYYLSTDANSEQIVSKLQLLTLHFPQLRLVWSPNPLATAVLFDELKEGRPEPSMTAALVTGKEDEDFSDEKFNPGIKAFLEKLPGVTSKNIFKLMFRGKSLDIIRKMNLEEITNLLENSEEAKLLYEALHTVQELPEDKGAVVGNSKKLFSSLRGKRKRFH